jgi:hypothetical protein
MLFSIWTNKNLSLQTRETGTLFFLSLHTTSYVLFWLSLTIKTDGTRAGLILETGTGRLPPHSLRKRFGK